MDTTGLKQVWYITRKFPPSVGGMQQLSFHIAGELQRHTALRLVAWRSGNWGLPLFMAWAGLRLLVGVLGRRVDKVLLGDPVLSLIALPARWLGTPVAVVVHGLDITYPSRPYQAYLRLAFWNRFSAYICISRHVLQLVTARGIPPGQRHLIHPGVEVLPASSAAPPMMEAAPRLLLLGRLVPRKGARWFVEQIMPLLQQRGSAISLDIVGDGPDRAALEAAIQRPGLANAVTLHGQVDDATKQALLTRADLVVMPNLPVQGDPEGFGLVALEAGAQGKWVVGADLEGLRDAVLPGATGTLLPPGDVDAWCDALVALCDDLPTLRARGLAAREEIRTTFSWRTMGERYWQVLNGLA